MKSASISGTSLRYSFPCICASYQELSTDIVYISELDTEQYVKIPRDIDKKDQAGAFLFLMFPTK